MHPCVLAGLSAQTVSFSIKRNPCLCSGEAVRDAAQAGSSPRALSSPTGQSLNQGMQGHNHKVSDHGLTLMLYPIPAGSWGHPVKTSEVGKCVHKGEVGKAKTGTA